MDTTTAPEHPRPLWVSIEGINGVGKTSAARAVATALSDRCLLLSELTDQTKDTLPRQVIAALAANGDACLRTGHPVVETLAVLALKAREEERFAHGYPPGVDLVIEDRGVDSVAVCQGAILAAHYGEAEPERLVRYVLSSARVWRRVPDATLLLIGNQVECAQRFGERIGRRLTPNELEVIYQTGDLYHVLAAEEPERFTVLDTAGRSLQQTGRAVEQIVRGLIANWEAVHAA